MDSILLLAIIIICMVFIVICAIKRRPDLIVNFILRASLGTAGIYLLDMVLTGKGYDINVGINGLTVMGNGLLGLPGFLLFYSLAIYYWFKN